MQPASLDQDPLLAICSSTVSARGWWKSPTSSSLLDATRAIQEQLANEPCLFRALLNIEHQKISELRLSESACRMLQQWINAGLSLRLEWLRSWSSAIREWLGPRFYFTASGNFASHQRYLSLVCSQLGRHGSRLPNWPSLMNAALQHSHRDRERPLVLPGTSLSEATWQFSARADLCGLYVQLEESKPIEVWFSDLFKEIEMVCQTSTLAQFAKKLQTHMRLSPSALPPDAIKMAGQPIQDRVAIALADRVLALHVRGNGTISHLLASRLSDPRFSTASVFVAATIGEPLIQQPEVDAWLERGAVAWLVPDSLHFPDRQLANCNDAPSSIFTQSICLPLHGLCGRFSRSESDWTYLTHCTRGNSGPLPDESDSQFLDRAWRTGFIPNCHALSTLQQILKDQRIRGNARLTRSREPCVSFSEVPLAELLSRRRFRSHLGRWDWEPYGILLQRDVSEQIGARPVLYGGEADYKRLAERDKPFFQPCGTKPARTNEDWSIEREWRLIGDLTLRDLPTNSVLVFVATRSQAHNIARRYPWPVVWVESGVLRFS